MKNIFGTTKSIKLYEGKELRYQYRGGGGYQSQCTYDSNGNTLKYDNSDGNWFKFTYNSNGDMLTYKNSEGDWFKYTRDSEGKELRFDNHKGERRGFDIPEYTMEELTKMIGKEFKVKK
jgi:YD repeat-containing protein